MPFSRIFVSYTHAGDERGSEVARQLITDLRANNAEVITDSETVSDENFLAFLNRELPQCQYLIFVQTPVALKSLRVQTAVNMALTMAAQQRIRNILRLIAVAPEGIDTQPQWSAARTFDASTDYLRARDKLFLELDLIQLDENMSLIMPPFPDSPSGSSPAGNNGPLSSPLSAVPRPPARSSAPLAPMPPSASGTSIPTPAKSFDQQFSGPVPRVTASGSAIPPVAQPSGLPRPVQPTWLPPQPGTQPPGSATPLQPNRVISNQPPPYSPPGRGPGMPGAYSNPAPVFPPPATGNALGNNYAVLTDNDQPQPLSKKSNISFPALFTRPFKTLQTRISAQPGKPSIDELETIREDRPLPLKTTRQTFIRWAVVIGLLLALILGTTLTVIQIRNHSQAPTTKNSHGTATTQPRGNTPTSTAIASSTQSVTAIDPQSTANPYFTPDNTLALKDDLAANDSAYQWHTATGTNSCSFTKNAYQIVTVGPNYCLADKSNFSDFVYQVQMKIVQGTTAGIVFRANNAKGTYYYFQLTTGGQFSLWRSDSSKAAPVRVPGSSTFAGAINQGLNAANIIAVSTSGSQLLVFVNRTNVVKVTDGTYTSGNIGVMAGAINGTGTTEAVYQYARVWTP